MQCGVDKPLLWPRMGCIRGLGGMRTLRYAWRLRSRVPGGSMRRLVAVLTARAVVPPYVVTLACSWRVRLLSTSSRGIVVNPTSFGTP